MALRYQEAEEISPAQDKRTVPLCSPCVPARQKNRPPVFKRTDPLCSERAKKERD
jgi:hypothetical protein